MRRAETLPLGVDLGHRRVRVALTERAGNRLPQLLAVASRDHSGDPAAALAEALEELHTRERRCVLALAPPDAVLTTVALPPMSRRERLAAARFEASAMIAYPMTEADVAVVPAGTPGRFVVGIVRRPALGAALAIARTARLRPVAVDDAAFALRRAHPDAGGIVDVGLDATRVTLFRDMLPHVVALPLGGAHFTAAIAHALGIELDIAEERKRRIGFAGAGESERDALIDGVAGVLHADGRATDRPVIVLCGNGSRAAGLNDAFERAGYNVRTADLAPEVSSVVPADVLRAAAPDWSLAYGLSLWETAA